MDYALRKGLIRNNDGGMGHYYGRYIRLEKGAFTEYLYHEVNENHVYDPTSDDDITKYYSFTIFNSDTICKVLTEECEVWEREVQNFESLPHMDMNQIKTYPIDILTEHLEK